MGMTNDFMVAVEEGATLVRVGTAIFGQRTKKQKQKATDEHGFSRIYES
jgi:PLP dependent protein